MFYTISTTPEQFRWFAGQLRACRAVIAESKKISQPLFGNRLANLARIPGAELLCSAVNIGMLGFPVSKLSDSVWDSQFQYRSSATPGIRQYPDGALYISQMGEDARVVCVDLPMLLGYPITSLMVKLDASDRSHPFWLVEPHQNKRPSVRP